MCSGFPTTHESFDLGKPFKYYKPITANSPNIRTVLEVTVRFLRVNRFFTNKLQTSGSSETGKEFSRKGDGEIKQQHHIC